jgi:hypothetical protein
MGQAKWTQNRVGITSKEAKLYIFRVTGWKGGKWVSRWPATTVSVAAGKDRARHVSRAAPQVRLINAFHHVELRIQPG